MFITWAVSESWGGWRLRTTRKRKSDPLANDKRDIMQHMNADHKDALILIAKRFAGIEAQQAEMTAVDRLGFHLRLKTQDGVKGTRMAFLREVSDPWQTREVFVEMVEQARRGSAAAVLPEKRLALQSWRGFATVRCIIRHRR